MSVFAQEFGGIKSVTIPEQKNLMELVTKGLGLAFGILLVLAGIFIFAAAFYYLTSATDETRRATAKNLILYSVVAVFVAAVSQGVIYIVKQFLGVGL